MTRFFLGQYLSERGFDHTSPDPFKVRMWAALRYVTVFAAVVVVAILFDRSPGGAFLTGIGGGVAVSGLLNVVFLPADERTQRDLLLLGAGTVAMLLGIYLLAAAS